MPTRIRLPGDTEHTLAQFDFPRRWMLESEVKSLDALQDKVEGLFQDGLVEAEEALTKAAQDYAKVIAEVEANPRYHELVALTNDHESMRERPSSEVNALWDERGSHERRVEEARKAVLAAQDHLNDLWFKTQVTVADASYLYGLALGFQLGIKGVQILFDHPETVGGNPLHTLTKVLTDMDAAGEFARVVLALRETGVLPESPPKDSNGGEA